MAKVLFAIMRSALGIPKPNIEKSTVPEIVASECAKHGWRWLDLEPILIKERLRYYEVWTNADRVAGRLVIDIDLTDGYIKSIKTLPR